MNNTTENQQTTALEKLTTLLEAALSDGILTQRERELLCSLAAKSGFDPDEFELLLEQKLGEIAVLKSNASVDDEFTSSPYTRVVQDASEQIVAIIEERKRRKNLYASSPQAFSVANEQRAMEEERQSLMKIKKQISQIPPENAAELGIPQLRKQILDCINSNVLDGKRVVDPVSSVANNPSEDSFPAEEKYEAPTSPHKKIGALHKAKAIYDLVPDDAKKKVANKLVDKLIELAENKELRDKAGGMIIGFFGGKKKK